MNYEDTTSSYEDRYGNIHEPDGYVVDNTKRNNRLKWLPVLLIPLLLLATLFLLPRVARNISNSRLQSQQANSVNQAQNIISPLPSNATQKAASGLRLGVGGGPTTPTPTKSSPTPMNQLTPTLTPRVGNASSSSPNPSPTTVIPQEAPKTGFGR